MKMYYDLYRKWYLHDWSIVQHWNKMGLALHHCTNQTRSMWPALLHWQVLRVKMTVFWLHGTNPCVSVTYCCFNRPTDIKLLYKFIAHKHSLGLHQHSLRFLIWVQCTHLNKQCLRFKVCFTLLREYGEYKGGRKSKEALSLFICHWSVQHKHISTQSAKFSHLSLSLLVCIMFVTLPIQIKNRIVLW